MFLVQATLDAPEYESSLQAEEKVTAKDKHKHKNKDDDIQVKLTHYEMLMDVNPNSDLATPIGKNLQLYVYFWKCLCKTFKNQPYPHPMVKGNIMHFSSLNRNSNSCPDAGTHAEES